MNVLHRICFAAFGLILLGACSHSIDSVLHGAIFDRFSAQFHRCVPLGWVPEPVDGSYVPGYSVEYSPRDVWLPPLWLGFVPGRALHTVHGLSAYRLLKEFVKAGLVESQPARRGTWYRLTERAVPYYFEGNDFGNNPLHLSYLCYSTIVLDGLAWSAGAQAGADGGDAHAFKVRFTWHSDSEATWAANPVVQRYSVTLAPTQSPAAVEVAKRDGSWEVARAYYDATNTLTNPSAWATSPPTYGR